MDRLDVTRRETGGRLASLPLHPSFVALHPVAAMAAANFEQMRLSDASRSAAVVLLAAGVLLIGWRALVRNWQKAALLTSLMLFLFFAYGQAYQVLKAVTIGGEVLGRHRFMAPLWVAMLVGGSWWILRQRGGLVPLTRWVNGISLVALAIPCGQIVLAQVREASESVEASQAVELRIAGQELAQDDLPDVYYIILDSYARSDINREFLGYDNTEFIKFLQDEGFYVAEESNANYVLTHLSLASSLNMEYLQVLVPGIETEAVHLYRDGTIKHSLVRRTFEEMGYQTIGFATGWDDTELFDADTIMTPEMTEFDRLRARQIVTPFESMLLSSSAARLLLDLDSLQNTPVTVFVAQRMRSNFDVQRDVILSIFDNVGRVPDIPGPKFVFAHIVSPHEPYLFAADGTYLWPEGPFTLADNDDIPEAERAQLFAGQSDFIDSELERTLATILETSTRPVIVIVQSDHGPRRALLTKSSGADGARAKAAILNAYYLPPECRSLLYPSISPVNSFRVVLSCVTGEDLPLLPDRTYFGDEDEMVPLEDVLK